MERRNFLKIILAAIAAPAVTPILKAADKPWPSKPIAWLALLDQHGKEWYGPGYSRVPIFYGQQNVVFPALGKVPNLLIEGICVHMETEEISIHASSKWKQVSIGRWVDQLPWPCVPNGCDIIVAFREAIFSDIR